MAGFRLKSRSSTPTGPIGKVIASLFFLIFLAFGVFFTSLILREAVRNIATWSWQETPCTILSSEVNDLNDRGKKASDYFVHVHYRYTFEGSGRTSERLTLQSKSFSDYAKATRLAEAFPAGSQRVCFVDSSKPADAVLRKGSAWMLLVVFFPLIFVAIGAGGIWFTWRGKSVRKEEEPKSPISDRATKGKGKRGLVFLFGIFLLMGSVFLYFFFIKPVAGIIQAKNWPEMECVVISSEVRSHDSDDGTTYSVNILYAYEFDGKEHRSNRYGFMGGSSSGHSGKAAIVRQHPRGKKTVCYVNPADPTEAVLQRGFTPVMWFGLLPLVFVLVGVFGLVHAVRKPGRQSALQTTGQAGSVATGLNRLDGQSVSGTTVLKPKTAPWVKVAGILFFATFWNGIVSIFLIQVIKSWQAGRPDWFQTIFLIPFVLIGLLLIFLVFYYFLALFNPRPRLKVTPGAVRLGETLSVEWNIKGRTNVLKRLCIRLKGREEATYRRGTRTYTDKNIFSDLEVVEITVRAEMRSGTAQIEVPPDLMHTFAGESNKIIWGLHLEGEIARWPDVKEEFAIEVLPTKGGRQPGS